MFQVERAGVCELAVGGVFYVVGVVFFKSDGLVPFAHAIWHLFVAAGACIHYYAIWRYLYLPGPLLQTSRWPAASWLTEKRCHETAVFWLKLSWLTRLHLESWCWDDLTVSADCDRSDEILHRWGQNPPRDQTLTILNKNHLGMNLHHHHLMGDVCWNRATYNAPGSLDDQCSVKRIVWDFGKCNLQFFCRVRWEDWKHSVC